ncbi:MAG: hypothetical protein VBE63_10630 [Lamprobacter sp.]|uniref:hypothetical protein n=1 Tax=Lamprobacter sp. TaxID=3100796 RepID=UPI002B260C8B|nr:hypothetical protein [Lamprobacter sp.]MEA3640388.1 hypothetical protein [Lamprobacter sp.]
MSARLTSSRLIGPRWRLIDALIAGVALTLMLIANLSGDRGQVGGSGQATGHPLIAVLTNALIFATAISVSFPIAD